MKIVVKSTYLNRRNKMGLEDRDYMSESKSNTNDVKACPKTGHWIGTVDWVDCSKCDFQSCNRQQFFRKLPVQAANPPDTQAIDAGLTKMDTATTNNICADCLMKDCPFMAGKEIAKPMRPNPATRTLCVIPTLKAKNQTKPTAEIIFPKDAPDWILKASTSELNPAKRIEDESLAKARVVMGNQIWNPKKGDWDNLDKPVRVHRVPMWLIIVGACIVVSIVITLIINHVQPGSRFSFFAW